MKRWHWLLLYVTMVMVLSCISASRSEVKCTSGGPYIVLVENSEQEESNPPLTVSTTPTSWRTRNEMSSRKSKQENRGIKEQQRTNMNDGKNGMNRTFKESKRLSRFKYVGEFDIEEWNTKSKKEKERAYEAYLKTKRWRRPIYLGKRCDHPVSNPAAPEEFNVTLRISNKYSPVNSVAGDPKNNNELCTTPDEMGRLLAVSEGLELITKGIFPVRKDTHGLLIKETKMLPEWAQMEIKKNMATKKDGLLSEYYLGGSRALCRRSTDHFIQYGREEGEEHAVEVMLPKVNVKVWMNRVDLCGYRLLKEVQTVCLMLLRNHRASLCNLTVQNVAVSGKLMSMKVFMDEREDERGPETFYHVNDRAEVLSRVEEMEKQISESPV